MAQNLTAIIASLQSDKVKSRQDALVLMDEALANDDIVDRLASASGSSKRWLAVFQALFVAVSTEKANCVKKGLHKATAVSITRLEKAGSVVRNSTERNVSLLPYKVVQPLLEHLMNTMVDKARDCLLAPVSLNYIKSIVVICSHSPHLDHFEPDLWVSLVSLAFAVILETSLASPRGFLETSFDGNLTQFDVDIDDPSLDTADDDNEGPIGSKRARPNSPRPKPQRRSISSPTESTRTMSQEQIEFMSLLVILLRSPQAPYLKPGIAQNILDRIHQFFVMFPTWSIAHTNAVVSVNLVFSQLELNMTKICTDFALKMWSPLLSYWNGKEKKDKVVREELVVTMITFFHLITVPNVAEISRNRVQERVTEFYECLQDDIDRSIFESLPLDSLRLHLRKSSDVSTVFDAVTFRSGYKFDPPHALSWAILELHADCARALHLYSEGYDGRTQPKRRRRESPLTDILSLVRKDTIPPKRRSDTLQVLLFVIDRHWQDLHDVLQQEICNTLLNLLVQDDLAMQSWTFLCLGAIAAAPGTVDDSSIDWNAMWSQAVHRTSVLGVGRAASHAAHVLLASQRLPIHRVLAEIEGFAANLVIQGPTFPFDSVCAFVCDCLRIASQDMRLYRSQVPDKVLAWLSQSWTVVGPDLRHQMPPQAIADVLALLEGACGFSRLSRVSLRYLLPDGVLTDTVIERHRTATHRDYLLHARLPSFRTPDHSRPHDLNSGSQQSTTTSLVSPSLREVKANALILRSLDLLCDEWKDGDDESMDATPEKVRRCFDAAVIALYFEASLMRNGTQSNRRVIQTACKLVARATPCIKQSKWKQNERALILMGLEPLVSDGESRREDDPWDLILGPVKGSGVKRTTLVTLPSDINSTKPVTLSTLRELQSVVWKSTDVQDTFDQVMADLRKTLEVLTVSQVLSHVGEEDEDFRHIQIANSTPSTSRAHGRANELCVQICITFLTVAPMLQSGSHSATHDKQLVTLLQKCEASAFLTLAPEFFQSVRMKYLYVTLKTAEMLKDRLEEVLRSYSSARSIRSTMLAIQFLHSTSHLWMQPAVAQSQLCKGVRLLHDWLSGMASEGKMASWRVRDRFVCYLDHYLAIDPGEVFWSPPVEDYTAKNEGEFPQPDTDRLPSHILPRIADDEDIRVRIRLAVANGRLLRTTEITKVDPMPIYERVKNGLSVYLDQFEHMLTRFLHLGNAMVVSSAVRRGPYWHLLETCLHDVSYTAVVEAVLSAVATRLGFPSLRSLFEAYASQLVVSILQSEKDFFRFPPSLLGYENRRQCGHATFTLLAPMVFVTTVADSTAVVNLRSRTFADHCDKAQKSVSEGLTECFADVVAITILNWIDTSDDACETSQAIAHEIHRISTAASDATEPNAILQAQLDRIVFSIMRAVCDTDYSAEGTISQALDEQNRSDRASAAFAALNVHRKPEDFTMHYPNTPAFSALTVWRSLKWLDQHIGGVFDPSIVYHVIHYLFAAVGDSPLVNEQMRLLHALNIWISINGPSFQDRTLLRTLLRGAIILLSQSDLARVAQGMIGWTFGNYASFKSLEPTFPDLLGRIARIAHDYAQEVDDPILAALGTELLDWLENEAWVFTKNVIKPQVISALPLWPRHPGGLLAQAAQGWDHYQSQPLSDLLRNPHGLSDKFRLVRRLSDLTNASAYAREQFCNEDFWHLKSCIPQHGEIQDEDTDAFVDLLFKHAAQIRSLDIEDVPSDLASTLDVQESRTIEARSKATVSPMRSIILSLLNLLSTEVAAPIHRAYRTLRSLFALPIAELHDGHAWAEQYQDEISYLRSCPLTPITTSSRSLEEFDTLEPLLTRNFQRWICEVAMLLSDVLASSDPFYAQLSPLIHSEPTFATKMLPVLVHGNLASNQNNARTLISRYFSSILMEEEGSASCCQAIVGTVLHLRNIKPTSVEPADPLAYDKWLDIDFRLLSRGAMACGAYTTALLFLELAADYSQSSGAAAATEDILYDIYSHIEEPDGFYAIKSSDVHGFLTRRFHHEGQWDMAFKFHGAEFAVGLHGLRGAEGIYQSLHSNGFDKLAMAVLQSSSSETIGTAPDTSQLGYELAWRTQMWDLPEPRGDGLTGSALYTALRAIHRNRDQVTVDNVLKNSSRDEMLRLRSAGNEDMVEIRSRVQTLICLGEIRKWRGAAIQDQLASKEISPHAWEDFVDISADFDFTTLENIIATRMSLLYSVKQREQREQIGDLETDFVAGLRQLEQKCLLRLSEAARHSENYQTALNAIMHAQRLARVPSFEVSQEFANVLWLLKEHKPAVEYLKNLVVGAAAPAPNHQEATKRALVLSRLGTWSSEACLQKPTDIREQYFAQGTTLLLGSESQEVDETMDPALAVVFQQYALFAEEQYHAILRSPEVSRLKVYVERKKQELEQLSESLRRTTSDSSRSHLSQHQRKATAIYEEDVAQFSVHTESRKTFLVQAIDMYSRCLQASDEFDDSAVIRLCSLWFANFGESDIQPNFSQAFARIASRKFIFLAHQLSARLSKPDKVSTRVSHAQNNLQSLILRMCREHPFHSLYQVWALQQGATNNEHDNSRRQSAKGASVFMNSGRGRAAADILHMCRQDGPNVARVQAIELLCSAYLEWAQYPLKGKSAYKTNRVQHEMPKIRLRDLSNLPVPVSTAYTPLDTTLQYASIVTVAKFSRKFTLAGGQNLPKISDCVGSDGRNYKQLFKGEGHDDLRQDAVMEQVFELVNVVLKRDRQTRKRQLGVRCYKVIPLSPQAGLLEFVENTMPIGAWLPPAHRRYHPDDLTPGECIEALKADRKACTQASGIQPDKMRERFLKMMQKFRPVFRHFFTERNKEPLAWFSTRLKYARSTATTSIVGHILGLGDRHVSNILIDKTTGELVHIDLGIAFDQGKLLPIPELVPFRLTADIVDGLGTAGTEGVFRRCAEETLRVLRAESGVITTVLEVFRHDPLHSWTASAIKIKRMQGPSDGSNMNLNLASDAAGHGPGLRLGLGIDMASDAADESADRALTSVRRKLDQSLSIEYTVNELITSATDPTNLCQIFVGWSPHL
ncbi:hypothetical protein JB92DRAFT_3041117 [Gautieria morchelliformis]|nr:hypothetical protein JB92DRAFT_3041117 [Gautieria morchelliformis]